MELMLKVSLNLKNPFFRIENNRKPFFFILFETVSPLTENEGF